MPAAYPSDLAVVLVDHGSTRDEANAQLDDVAQLFRGTTGARIVEVAHMELAEPTIAQAFARCVAQGARRVVIHPYFLAPGRHSTTDIPRMAAEAAAAHPGVAYVVTSPLGLDPRMAEIIRDRIAQSLNVPWTRPTDRAPS
jgi:sirohydrochlorin ferrochelatase